MPLSFGQGQAVELGFGRVRSVQIRRSGFVELCRVGVGHGMSVGVCCVLLRLVQFSRSGRVEARYGVVR